MVEKSVGIITIISKNYGNRLQNYALQSILEMMNMKAETIPMIRMSNREQIKMILKFVLSPFFKDRNWEWDRYNFRHIHWSKYTHKDLKLCDAYKYFIAGSDQIWNPLFYFNSEREFLTFAPPEKRIAYAASIGLYELPDSKTQHNYAAYWKEFKMISVREDAAARIIEKAVNIKVPVVLDPTMMLSVNEWDRLSRQSKIKPCNKYIVCYFFEKLSPEVYGIISEFAKKNQAEIIDITPEKAYKGYQIGPIEFLYLIQHSTYVFTDSFHGTALSIVFKCPFLAFHRKEERGTGDMTSRIDTVLNMFGLRERYVEERTDINIMLGEEINYKGIELRIQEKRTESLSFLRRALDLGK